MGAQFTVAIILKGIDRATAPVTRVAAVINRVRKPIDDVLGRVKLLSEAGGLPKLKAAAGDAASAIGDLFGQLQRTAVRMFAIGALVVGTTYALARSAAHYGDELGDTSKKLGISAERLQEWRFAANLAGVENDRLTAAVFQLEKQAASFAQGNPAARQAFFSLGRGAFDARGHLLPVERLLPLIADKLRSISDPARRAGLASQLFGKQARDMMPWLLEGSDGMARMAARARELGLVLSNEAIKSLGDMSDELDITEKVVRSAAFTIGAELAPTIVDIAKKIQKWVTENRPMLESLARTFAKSLPAAFELVKDGINVLMVVLSPFVAGWQLLCDVIGPAPALLLVLAGVMVASLVPAVIAVVATLSTLSAALVGTPAGWVILAITGIVLALIALGVGIYALVKNWDKWSKAYIEHWKFVWRSIVAVCALIQLGLIKAWKFVFDWAGKIGGFIVDKIVGAWSGLKTFFGGLWDWVEGRFESAYKWIVDKVAAIIDFLPDWMKEGLGISVPTPEVGAGAPIGSERRAAAAGVSGRFESRATIKVDFDNMPRGTRVTPKGADGADLDLNLGYSMQSP